MWPFKRKAPEPKVVDVDESSYGRWLRSARPDLVWFLSLPDDQQEALAQLGDGYMKNVGIMLGKCISDPDGAEIEAMIAEGDEAGAASLLERMANMVAQPAQPAPRPPRMRPVGGRS